MQQKLGPKWLRRAVSCVVTYPCLRGLHAYCACRLRCFHVGCASKPQRCYALCTNTPYAYMPSASILSMPPCHLLPCHASMSPPASKPPCLHLPTCLFFFTHTDRTIKDALNPASEQRTHEQKSHSALMSATKPKWSTNVAPPSLGGYTRKWLYVTCRIISHPSEMARL